MRRACALLAVLTIAAPAASTAQPRESDVLARFAPVLVYDADERSLALPVDSVPYGTQPRGRAIDVPRDARGPAVVYGREASGRGGRRLLQYWLFFAHNGQDRGIVHTGRHAGDWELAMVALDSSGRPVEATVSQHSGGETCGWSNVRRDRAGHPLVYVANASHALYFRPGTRDRTWPDPNDEADGRGRRVAPAVRRLAPGHAGRVAGAALAHASSPASTPLREDRPSSRKGGSPTPTHLPPAPASRRPARRAGLVAQAHGAGLSATRSARARRSDRRPRRRS